MLPVSRANHTDQANDQRDLREVNEALIAMSVRQHELIEEADQARLTAESALAELRASRQQLATELEASSILHSVSTELVREAGDELLVYERIMEAAVAIMGSQFSSIQIYYPARGKHGELKLLANRGFTQEAEGGWQWVAAESDCTCSMAMRLGRRVIVPDVNTCEHLGDSTRAAYNSAGIAACQSTPLLSRSGQLIGATSTHWDHPHEPTERDLRLFDILARQVADLIERKKGEEANALLAAIVESSDDAIATKDLNGIITSWNAGAEYLFGYTAHEAIGQPVTMLMPPDRVDEEPGIMERIRRGERIEHYETVRRRKDGTLLDVSLTVSPINDSQDRVVGASKVVRDISERKILQRERDLIAEREHNIASQLQAALQPPLPDVVSGLAVTQYYEAAWSDEALVGGDFFDVFAIEKDRTALVLGDLSGKGLEAAAQVSIVRNMLRAFLYSTPTVAEAVAQLNHIVSKNNLLRGFSTLFVGTFDAVRRGLRYVNCGQEPALVRRCTTGAVEALSSTGPILGTIENARYSEKTIALVPGDALAIFTDGLTEVGPTRNAMLGIEGLINILGEPIEPTDINSPRDMADYLAARLIAGIDEASQGGVRRDDICLLVAVVEDGMSSNP